MPLTMAAEPAHSGKAVYDKHCASCHDHPETRAPAFDTLKGMRYGSIHYALTEGKMQVQGKPLSAAERASVIDFLVGRSVVDDAWVTKMMCAPDSRAVDLKAPAIVSGFGFDTLNHRHLTREQ